MKTYAARTCIDAPVGTVWFVLSRVEAWPDWTPTVTRAEADGPLGVGARVFVVQPRLRPATWTVVEWDPGRTFVWKSGSRCAEVVARHDLRAVGNGTLLTLATSFRGALSPLLAAVWGRIAERYVQEEARRLKARCEG